MEQKNQKIHIIGAGISGLIAANVLEKYGHSPVILEATDRAGGRVKTDIVDGFQLDHGFQVLLSGYPAAQKYLDYKALQLQKFKSGSCIFIDGKQKFIGDPMRDPGILFSTLFSGIGNLSDKIKIMGLNAKLRKKSVQEIFKTKEISTYQYLRETGFSEEIIHKFFRPFFNGIFLETELQTSSRMFEFVLKMFGEGYAMLPKGGIEEIAKQLTGKLQKTNFLFNTKVSAVSDSEILLENGEKIPTGYTIIATEAESLIENSQNPQLNWKSCQTLYFVAPRRLYQKPFIGLVANKTSLINNIFYHTSLQMKHRGEGELLSLTVVKNHNLNAETLISKVKAELQKECGIDNVRFLKMYDIPKALPNLKNLHYEVPATETKLTNRIFLAGDVQLNGSLNAAMIAGETAAKGLLKAI